MNEYLALGRLLLSRMRTPLTALIAFSLMGLVLARVILAGEPGGTAQRLVLPWIVSLTQFPLLLYAVILVDWSSMNLDNLRSGFNPFLLRSPVSTRALAIVPMAMKLLLLLFMGGVLLLMFPKETRDEMMPYILPLVVSLGSAGAWVCAFSWRPVRRSWQRMIGLIVLGPLSYAIAFTPLMFHDVAYLNWLRIGHFPIPAIVWFVLGWVCAIRSLKLARVNSYGLYKPEKQSPSGTGSLGETEGNVGVKQVAENSKPLPEFGKNTWRALSWYDWQRAEPMLLQMLAWVGLPLLLVFAMIPLSGMTLVLIAMFVYIIVVMMNMGGWAELGYGNANASGRMTPNLLAVSPVPFTLLAGIKLRRCIQLAVFGCLIATCWTVAAAYLLNNMYVYRSWVHSISGAEQQGLTAAEQMIGYRMSIVVIVFSILMVTGRTVALLWTCLLARRWVSHLVGLLAISIGLFAFGYWFVWILSLSDFDEMAAGIDRGFARIPNLVMMAVWAKGLALLGTILFAWRTQPIPASWTWRVVVGWLIVVVGCAAIIMLVTPPTLQMEPRYEVLRPTWLRCLTWIALILPVSRVIILPWALAKDVHR